MYGIYPPCKDCKDRKPACHDKCELYKKYREKIILEKNIRKEYSELKSYIFDSKHLPEFTSPMAKKYATHYSTRSNNE